MKTWTLLILSLVTCHPSLFSQTASITNIQVAQRTDGSGLTDIYFTVVGTATAYYIAAEASFNGGSTFTPIPGASVSGDTGPITAGTGKHIIWNGLQSFPNTYSTQAKVKLIATTTPPSGLPCSATPTVVYGGQTYNTVQIGTQCWFKENLNIGTRINGSGNQTNNGTIEKYCYSDLESNCAIYGGFYQWNEMMQYITTPGMQGICPAGWHVPTEAEWTTATTFLGGTSVASGKMKSTGTIQAGTGLWNTPNTGATNQSGFTAVPAGMHTYSGFYAIGNKGYWWSSSESQPTNAIGRYIVYNSAVVGYVNYYKTSGYSVRCVLDF